MQLPNARWKALAEIYTMHSFAPFLESEFEKPGQKEPGQNTPFFHLNFCQNFAIFLLVFFSKMFANFTMILLNFS